MRLTADATRPPKGRGNRRRELGLRTGTGGRRLFARGGGSAQGREDAAAVGGGQGGGHHQLVKRPAAAAAAASPACGVTATATRTHETPLRPRPPANVRRSLGRRRHGPGTTVTGNINREEHGWRQRRQKMRRRKNIVLPKEATNNIVIMNINKQ